MRRRDFLTMTAMTAAGVATRDARLFGQPPGRAAVVIGVNKVGTLPRLGGAASDAIKLAAWLRAEGFETRVLVDEDPARGPGIVRANDVYDAVASLAEPGTLTQLVIYFSGHGFVKNNSEFWMLSNAPDNPNEAISLMESHYLAARSGIPNVAFISDACRSTINSLEADGVHGSLIFSTRAANAQAKTDVDRFLATGFGQASNEVSTSAKQFEGIYTAAFLSAFAHPDPTMVSTVRGVQVVPNRRLSDYLLREVRARARSTRNAQEQDPDTYVVSKDDVYIGRATGSAPAPITTNEAPALAAVARQELSQVGLRGLGESVRPIGTLGPDNPQRSRFTAAKGQLLQRPVDSAPTVFQTGFIVSGAPVKEVIAASQLTAAILPSAAGGSETARIRVDMSRVQAGSVALDFGAFGTVVAALQDYVGYITVEQDRVVNVNYLPSYVGGSDRAHLRELHATVATATRFGVFRIEGGRDNRAQAARTMAGSLRALKRIDPTLGIYAAYAYAESDIQNEVQSVMNYMRQDLGIYLFDVAMLSGVLAGRSIQAFDPPVIPFCPMLSQGWNLLRVREIVAPELVIARDHVREALWTTLDRTGLDAAIRALRERQLR